MAISDKDQQIEQQATVSRELLEFDLLFTSIHMQELHPSIAENYFSFPQKKKVDGESH